MTTGNTEPTIKNDNIVDLQDAIQNQEDSRDFFPVGMKSIDEAMDGGFRGQDLIIVSGIPGHGKTTLAQTWTYDLITKRIPCLWFSYEVSYKHLDRKFQAMGLRHGDVTETLYHVSVPNHLTTGKLGWLKQKIRDAKREKLTQVVFIDHIDFLIPSDVTTSDNQAIALKKIATELKSLAIQENVAIVCMAHLKKLPDGKEPDMQDIGYSAGIFQLPDYVFIIWRAKKREYQQSTVGDIYSDEATVKLVKNRLTGATRYQRVKFQDGRFQEINMYR